MKKHIPAFFSPLFSPPLLLSLSTFSVLYLPPLLFSVSLSHFPRKWGSFRHRFATLVPTGSPSSCPLLHNQHNLFNCFYYSVHGCVVKVKGRGHLQESLLSFHCEVLRTKLRSSGLTSNTFTWVLPLWSPIQFFFKHLSWVGIVLTTQNQEKMGPIVPYKMPEALCYCEKMMSVGPFLHSGMVLP